MLWNFLGQFWKVLIKIKQLKGLMAVSLVVSLKSLLLSNFLKFINIGRAQTFPPLFYKTVPPKKLTNYCVLDWLLIS